MFERRLRIILVALSVAIAIIVIRLLDLQVVHAAYYRQRAERVLLKPPRVIPFVRGRILDRTGRILAGDEPCWQLSVDYPILAGELSPEDSPAPKLIESMWYDLAQFSAESLEELDSRRTDIVNRIQRWRRAVTNAHGYDVSIREERMPHGIITGLDDQAQIAARQKFAGYDWVVVENSARRTCDSHPSLGHLLGQLGAPNPDDLRNDPNADDMLSRLLPTERIGISGVERASEEQLRGRRGLFQRNRRGEVVQNILPSSGEDTTLTVRFDLQKALYELLDEMLPAVAPDSPGGSIVVLDVATREVLALVSYPGYDANTFRRQYNELRDDTIGTPLRFRAVANCYEPGSIVKPLTCLAGMGTGVIDAHTTIHCDGYYDRQRYLNSYRCWKSSATGQRKAHGDIPVADAIAHSCNVFMYHVGDRVGPDRLCNYFKMAGFGARTGTGLREEREGINPTPSWLMDNRNQSATRGHARNFAIGQGELVLTPLQAANMMALYASGEIRNVSLRRGSPDNVTWNMPVSATAWHSIREGLFRVTNDPSGTAHATAYWNNGRYALCGKTGSATTRPTPTHYRISYEDASGAPLSEVVPAKVKRHAAELFRARFPNARFDPAKDVSVESRWPPPKPDGSDEHHSHAWFAGYLQPLDSTGRPDYQALPPIAFAVLIEFGGSGGHTTGPVAKEISRVIVEVLGNDLDPDSHVGVGTLW